MIDIELYNYIPKDLIIPPGNVSNKGGIWLGNYDAAHDWRSLKFLSINYVVSAMPKNYSSDKIHDKFRAHDINFLHIQAEDAIDQDLYQYFEDVSSYIGKSRKQGNILIHCHAGVSRSTTLLIAYQMWDRKNGWKQELDFIKDQRPNVDPNSSFRKQLMEWESYLKIDKI